MKTNPGPCETAKHRQFDFWLGDWDVYVRGGTLAGRNRIAPLFGGCALRERWEGVSGHRGTSLNVYDVARQSWHQTWVDAHGVVLQLDGGLVSGAMVLEGSGPSLTGDRLQVRHRISWSLIDGDPDRVRQLWQTSSDNASWETVFDGHYLRRTVRAAPRTSALERLEASRTKHQQQSSAFREVNDASTSE